MNTYAIVYLPDLNAGTQTVKEVKEIANDDQLAQLRAKYPGRVDGQAFVSVLYTSDELELTPGQVVPLGYDPLDTD